MLQSTGARNRVRRRHRSGNWRVWQDLPTLFAAAFVHTFAAALSSTGGASDAESSCGAKHNILRSQGTAVCSFGVSHAVCESCSVVCFRARVHEAVCWSTRLLDMVNLGLERVLAIRKNRLERPASRREIRIGCRARAHSPQGSKKGIVYCFLLSLR